MRAAPRRRLKAEENDDQPVFLRKAFSMISTCPPDIGGWSENGDTVIIKDVKLFADKVIPTAYKHNNFSSFVRQLNFYGFRKIKSASIEKSAWWEFRHPQFRRGAPHLLGEIKRSVHFEANSAQEVTSIKSDMSGMNDRITALHKQMDVLAGMVEGLKVSSNVQSDSTNNSNNSSSSMALEDGRQEIIAAATEAAVNAAVAETQKIQQQLTECGFQLEASKKRRMAPSTIGLLHANPTNLVDQHQDSNQQDFLTAPDMLRLSSLESAAYMEDYKALDGAVLNTGPDPFGTTAVTTAAGAGTGPVVGGGGGLLFESFEEEDAMMLFEDMGLSEMNTAISISTPPKLTSAAFNPAAAAAAEQAGAVAIGREAENVSAAAATESFTSSNSHPSSTVSQNMGQSKEQKQPIYATAVPISAPSSQSAPASIVPTPSNGSDINAILEHLTPDLKLRFVDKLAEVVGKELSSNMIKMQQAVAASAVTAEPDNAGVASTNVDCGQMLKADLDDNSSTGAFNNSALIEMQKYVASPAQHSAVQLASTSSSTSSSSSSSGKFSGYRLPSGEEAPEIALPLASAALGAFMLSSLQSLQQLQQQQERQVQLQHIKKEAAV